MFLESSRPIFGTLEIDIGSQNPILIKSKYSPLCRHSKQRKMLKVHRSTTSKQGNSTTQIVKMFNSGGNNMISNQCKLLGATNFGAWKFKMKNILMRKMLWHLVSPNPIRRIMEEDSTITTQEQMKALMIINLSIKDEVKHISS